MGLQDNIIIFLLEVLMPELPEVETSRRGIEPWMVGYTILWIEVRNVHLRWPVTNEIISLRNRRVLSVGRRAKYILLVLDSGYIIVHLGMSGQLRVLLQPQPPNKHDHIDLVMSNGCIIRYIDPRRFGAWLWSNDLLTSPILTHLGPEPLSNEFNGCWLFDKSRNKSSNIKHLLMNNRLVVGVGNIYASESLFAAQILPSRPAKTLSKKEAILLADSIKLVLLRAIKHGGTTLQNFYQPNGKPGYFIQVLKVYGRSGEPCFVCGTRLKIIKLSQRSTFFCPNCQH